MNLTQRSDRLTDGRDDLPIFIHSELDDLGLSSKAFRVYAHLVRRVGRNGEAWPSYQSIGEVCFLGDYPNSKGKSTLKKHAIAAIRELIEYGLITVEVRRTDRKENLTNIYRLTPRREWKTPNRGGSLGEPGSSTTEPGCSESEPKDTPVKVLSNEFKSSKISKPTKAFPKNAPSEGEESASPHSEPKPIAQNTASLSINPDFHGSNQATVEDQSSAATLQNLKQRKKARKAPILTSLELDDEGWAQLPEGDRYKLANFIATRRMQYLLICFTSDRGKVSFGVLPDRAEYAVKGRQMFMMETNHSERDWEDEVLAPDGPFALRLLRSVTDKFKGLDQELYNSKLEEFFIEAQRFLTRPNAKQLFDTTPLPALFPQDDLLLDDYSIPSRKTA